MTMIVGDTVSFSPTITPSVTTATYSVSSGSLPAGLSLNTSTGVISGTATSTAVADGNVVISANIGMRTISYTMPYRVYVKAGIENGTILNTAMTASSFFDSRYAPYNGRLNGTNSWEPKTTAAGSWLQVDLAGNKSVGAIAVQGAGPNVAAEWVTSYTVEYSTDTVTWTQYNNSQVLTRTNDRTSITKNKLTPFTARYVRVYPKTWYIFPSMRMELYTF